MRKLSFLFLCIMLGIGLTTSPAGAEVLKEGLNGVWFENVELIFDESGNEIPFNVTPYHVVVPGDHFVGIVCIQGVRVKADPYHWDQGTGEQVTGIFAIRVEAVEPGITWTDNQGNVRTGARITFGAPTVTTFNAADGSSFSTGVVGDEMFAIYHQVPGTTPYEFNGTIVDDVAKATDGPLWATFGHGAGADGVWGTADDDGYAYTYTDELGQPAANFSGAARYALNAIQNNTGWNFTRDLNDPDEAEIGDTLIPGLLNDMYMNSEFTSNPYWVSGSSPWVFQSNDPAYLRATQEQPPGSCRMTGGQNRVIPAVGIDGLDTWGYEFEQLDGDYFVTTGGQIGAPSVDEPRGHWTHVQHGGAEGVFTFHSGTSSAPEGTEISTIECADPGWCVQARCAPFKQIFWTGVGNFAKQGFDGVFSGCTVVADIPRKGGTLHFYRAMVGDFGENKRPTREDALVDDNPLTCDWFARLQAACWPGPPGPFDASLAVFLDSMPDDQFGDKGGQICDKCPDYYQIEIHCTTDPNSEIIYTFQGFIDGGNYQIHPETGEQCPSCPELSPELYESTKKLPPGLNK